MRRYRITSRPHSADAPTSGWSWHVSASDDPVSWGGFGTWLDAMGYVEECVQRDRTEAAGMCPFSHHPLVECQHTVCDDCGIPTREGPVDDVPPCGHRETYIGCGGCDAGAIAFVVPDSLLPWVRLS